MASAGSKHTGAFDCIRLLAASGVLISHSYALAHRGGKDPLMVLSHDKTNFSEIAVYMFFVISGYLVTQSWQRDPDAKRFLMRRLLRLVPALAVVLVASVFIIGPLMTTLPLADYFARARTWTYLGKIFLYPLQYGLPGVFDHNPEPSIVNGSLWTLRAEFTLYLIVAGLGVAGFMRTMSACAAIVLVCIGAQIVTALPNALTFVPAYHHTAIMSANAMTFFIGACLASVKLRWSWVGLGGVIFAVFAFALFNTVAFKPCLLIAVSLLTILAAEKGRCDLSRYGDFSYGVYLWAFVFQQTIVAVYPGVTVGCMIATAGCAALMMGALSWHLVEKQALKFKPRRA